MGARGGLAVMASMTEHWSGRQRNESNNPATPEQPDAAPAAATNSSFPSRYDVEGHLLNWADWMRQGGLPRGAPSNASGGLRGFKTHSEDEELNQHEYFDRQNARTCDAAIRDLPLPHRRCIHSHYLDASYEPMVGHPFEKTLDEARRYIRDGLRRRGVYVAE